MRKLNRDKLSDIGPECELSEEELETREYYDEVADHSYIDSQVNNPENW